MLKLFFLCLSSLFGVLGAAAPAFAQDLVPPSVAVVSPVNSSYRNSLASITGTAFDSSGISEVRLTIKRVSDNNYWDGAAFTAAPAWLSASVSSLTWSYDAFLPPWANGASYSISARALDLAANWSVVYSTAVFYYDTGAPLSAVLQPANGSEALDFSSGLSGTAWDTESFTAQVWAQVTRASDSRHWNGAISQWTVDEVWNLATGSAPWTYTGLPETSLTYGSVYFAESRASDLAGNVSLPVSTISFVYSGASTDLVRPYTRLLYPLDGMWTDSLASVYGDAGDNVGVSSVTVIFKDLSANKYWSGGAWDSVAEIGFSADLWASSWTYTSVPAWVSGSSYAVSARALDSSGNWALLVSSAAFHFDSGIPAGCGPSVSARSGAWSAPSTWSPMLTPAACNSVTIEPGHIVTVDIATAVAGSAAINGQLTFSRVNSSALTLSGGNLAVNPGGTLDLGNGGSPIPAAVGATLVLSSGTYAGQYALTVYNGGNFSVRGAAKTPYAYATQNITTSDTSLKVYGSTSTDGWQAGDTITIGPTSGSGLAATSRRVIASITGGPEYTVAWTGGTLPYARNPTAATPVVVANLTRNVLVRSSGTVVDGELGNSAHITNLARNTTSFAVAYGEFAYLGDRMGFKYSLAFDSLSRGEISSSTFRDSSYGLYLYNSSGNTLYGNNFYANWYGGIKLHNSSFNTLAANTFQSNQSFGAYIYNASRNNILTGNSSYSNSSYGLYLYDSCNDNTLTGNNSYSNSGYGIDLVSASNNTLAGNNYYSNAASGIYLDIASNANMFLGENSYSNSGPGLSPSASLNNAFVGGSLGFDRAGADKPNAGGEVSFDPATVSSLVLKEGSVNPATGVAAAGMNRAGSYLLSYNQDADTGTLRLWGNYQVADSVLALEHAARLYEPANTVPKLLHGAGHSLVNVVAKDAALTEFITVKFIGTVADLWEVTGSSSGFLGGFSRGPVDAFNFSHPKVAFRLVTGAVLNFGDTLEFVTIAASGDANSPKKLLFGPAAPAYNQGRSKLEVAPAGGVVLRGKTDGTSHTLVDRLDASSPYYTFVGSGAFTAEHSSFSNLDQDGLQLSGSGGVLLSSSSFDFLGFDAGTNSYLTARDLVAAATFYNVSFGLALSSAGYGPVYNLRVEGSDAGLALFFKKAQISLGELWGEDYDQDPGGKVVWFDAIPDAPAGCGTEETRHVGKSGYIYSSIQAAVDSLPAALGATACVVIRDAAVYDEQVTVGDRVNNGYRLKIMADPTFVSSAPAVSPPALSTAAFRIFNDSVTLQGINITPADPVAYGILSSSAGLTLSGVGVAAGGNIFTAGVSLSSGSVVSDSGVAVQDAAGLLLTGTLSVIGQSTITCDTARYSALTFSGAASNTVTNSFLSNPGGRAVYLSTGADHNSIGQSVIASASGAALMFGALYIFDSSSNTVADTVISNPAGVAAYLGLDANYNSIVRSTITSVSTGYQALRISGGSYNTVDSSLMSTPGGYAAYIGLNSGSDYNTISRSTITSNAAALSALYIYQASSNTVTGSVISNPSGDGAYLLDASDGNTISYSSITSNGAGKYALLFSGVSSNTVESCYLGNPAGYGAGLTGVSGYNSIARSTLSVNSAYTALSIDNSSNNTVTRSNISNPSGYGALIGFGADSNTLSYDSVAVNAAAYFAVKLQNAAFNVVSYSFLSNPAGVAYTSVFGSRNGLSYSTVTSGAWAYSAVFVDASDYHAINNSYIRGANALFVRDSTAPAVVNSVLIATNTAGTGLRFDTSNDSLSSGNRISASGTGILVNAGNSGVVSVTSDTVSGAAYGFSAGAQAAGGSLDMSGVNFDSLAPGATAIKFLGGTFVSTFTAMSFNSTGPAVNVDGTLLAPGSAITLRDYFGARSGPLYEKDPSGYVYWSAEDTAPPSVAVLQPVHNSLLNSLPAVSGTAWDIVAVSSVVVSIFRNDAALFWDGSAWAAGEAWLNAAVYPSSWTYAAVPGLVDASSYTVSARAMDSSGNWSSAAEGAFTYDITPPLSAVVQPASVASATFTFVAGTASDAHGITQVQVGAMRIADSAYWNGSVWTSTPAWPLAAGTTSWLYAGIPGEALSSGSTYHFMAKAYDAAGNVSDPFLALSTFAYVVPPEGVFSTAPFSGTGAAAFTVNWGTTFSAGKVYYVRLSSHAASSPYVGSATTTATAYGFSGLAPNSRYYGFVSTTSSSGYFMTGTGLTQAAAPSTAAFTAVAYSSAAIGWSGGANPAFTVYQYEVSVSTMFLVIASSGSGVSSPGWLTGLEQGTTYYGRVLAYNSDGASTAYAYPGVPAVTLRMLPSGAAASLAGAAQGVSAINWSWASGTLASADYLAVYHDGVFSATAAFAASGTSLQTGLTPNTSHFLGVAGRNVYGQGATSVSSPVYTLAAVPSGLGAQVAISSAVLSWGLNGNSAGTMAQLWRSVDNLIFSSIFEGPVLSYNDISVNECSSYYYRVRNRNGAGVYTAFGGTINFATQASTPAAPSGLYAEALGGARIALAWDFSPWPGVTQYNLYYDNATGTINYAVPYAVFTSTESGYTTPALAAGSSYKFGLRAVNRCGIEEQNITISASAQAVGVLSGVRAAIKSPQTGKKIKGNRVTVVAEIILGLPSQIKQVRFQARLQGSAAWTDLGAANANHPNPDTTAPYFTHWDADAMAPGTYELRVLATDIYNSDDPAPPTITVSIDPADYDCNETVVGGAQQKEEKINNAVTSTVHASDEETSLVSKVVIPAGAVDVTTVAVTLVSNPPSKPVPPSGSEELSLAVKINLSSGQSLLSGGKTAAVTLSYKDDNGDGIVDGTNAPLDRLRMYSAPDGGGAWTEMATSVDREKKTISGVTTHFSFFSVFAAPASSLGGIKAYPNPWQPGAGGRFDAAAGITFANVPTGSRIKIFTIMGELVRQLEVAAADANTKIWDGRNTEGHKAASGVYIVLVNSGSTDRTFKIAVER